METLAVGISALQEGLEMVTGREPTAGTDEVLQRVRRHLSDPDMFALLRVEHQSLVIAAVAMLITLTVLIAGSVWSNMGGNSGWEPRHTRTNSPYVLRYTKDRDS